MWAWQAQPHLRALGVGALFLCGACAGSGPTRLEDFANGKVSTSAYQAGLSSGANKERMGNATADGSVSDTPDTATADGPPASMEGRHPSEPAATSMTSSDDDAGLPWIPPLGSATDDPRCGNGVLDDTELCDVSIKEGEPGACPLVCPANDACHPEMLIAQGCFSRCVPSSQPQPSCP